jgi:hypothetical protein
LQSEGAGHFSSRLPGREHHTCWPSGSAGRHVCSGGRSSAHDQRLPEDLLGDIEIHLTIMVERHHVRIMRGQSFVTRTLPEIMQDGFGRNRHFVQLQGECRQVRLCLPCLQFSPAFLSSFGVCLRDALSNTKLPFNKVFLCIPFVRQMERDAPPHPLTLRGVEDYPA